MSGDLIRVAGGRKWHRGGRYDYPGAIHCPVGLGLVLLPRNCETAPIEQTDPADWCARCAPDLAPTTRTPEESPDE